MIEKNLRSLKLEPHWPSLARYFANAFATHSFDSGFVYGPVASFVEVIAYLAQTDPAEVKKIVAELRTTEGIEDIASMPGEPGDLSNAGCDRCGTADREPGSVLCASCATEVRAEFEASK